jgi:hypothetical protein
MYKISELILRYTSRSKEDKLNIVKKLGYKNLNKGFRRLDNLIQTGQCPDSLRKKLPTALGLEPSVIQEAYELTLNQLEEEEEKARRDRESYERRMFQPHLWIKHEREYPPVGSICQVALLGIHNFKVITLPEDILGLQWSEQCKTVREKIREHQSQEYVDTGLFRKVIEYIYRKTYDKSFLFSTNGNFLEIYSPKVRKPEIYLKVGNKKIHEGLLK